MDWRHILADALDKAIEYSITSLTNEKQPVFQAVKKIRLYSKLIKYNMHKRQSEAFFEKGKLYQISSSIQNEKLKFFTLYSMDDIKFAIEEANRGDLNPFILRNMPSYLKKQDIFMLIEIRRYRFDYVIMKILVGDQMFGLICYDAIAMYPWDVFTPIT